MIPTATIKMGIFSLTGTPSSELKQFQSLIKLQPHRGKEIYAVGEKLVTLAKNGEYMQFKRYTNELSPDDVLCYFVAKALFASLMGGHLILASFIIDNGYPIKVEHGLPNILHDCLKELDDYQCAPISTLLISKGYNVNRQEPVSWLSPLHIAVQKQMRETIVTLVKLGADVNAVGSNDVMPLPLAHAAAVENDGGTKQFIIKLLLDNGAKTTWRKDNSLNETSAKKDYFSTPFTTNAQVSVGNSPTVSTSTAIKSNVKISSNSNNRVRFNGAQLAEIATPLPVDKSPTPNKIPAVTVEIAKSKQFMPVVTVSASSGKDFVSCDLSKLNYETLVNDTNNSMDNSSIFAITQETNVDDDEILVVDGVANIEMNDSDISCFVQSTDGAAFLFSTG